MSGVKSRLPVVRKKILDVYPMFLACSKRLEVRSWRCAFRGFLRGLLFLLLNGGHRGWSVGGKSGVRPPDVWVV